MNNRKTLLTLMMLVCTSYTYAQSYYQIEHTNGMQTVHGHSITVNKIEKPKTGRGECGLDGYWIGYAANNAYEFTFDKPVNSIRLRISSINKGEMISITLNGNHYGIRQETMSVFNGDCLMVPLPEIENGNIVSRRDYCNAEILLSPKEKIQSLSIAHMNGIKGGAGVVFDIAIVENNIAGAGNAGTNNGSTGINDAVLQPGMFAMLPNPATETFRLAFLPSSSGKATVTITDMAGRKVQIQNYDCSKGVANTHSFNVLGFVPGNYTVELSLNDEYYIQKLVKL